MPNFASLSCFYSKLRWGEPSPPPPSKIGCPNTPSKIGLRGVRLDLGGHGTSEYYFSPGGGALQLHLYGGGVATGSED